MALKVSAQKAAEIAIGSIGSGYDLAGDLSLKYCNRDAKDFPLIEMDEVGCYDVALPAGGISISNVSKMIKCSNQGQTARITSDVNSFEHFNNEMSLSGKIPCGFFNAMFDFSGCWQNDSAGTKNLAFDGVFITLYTVSLENPRVVLRDHVRKAVPSSWQPAVLARFIRTFGTHIIVGVKMGGKDVIYVKQQHPSMANPADVQTKLKKVADDLFLQDDGQNRIVVKQVELNNEHISIFHKRRGGTGEMHLSHAEWLRTVQVQPDVISMSFIPITSLLNGVPGCGILTHAINLYLRYKPPLDGLQSFLEFQLPRKWAPDFQENLLASQQKRQSSSFVQFKFFGPKLYVSTIPVDVGKRPVTGLRLYLEGNRSNRLAINMQHLSSLPAYFRLVDEHIEDTFPQESYDKKYFEKVRWKNFSRVCTAPVESNNDHSMVTGAQLQVEKYGSRTVLFLRLHFSTVLGDIIVRQSEWDRSFGFATQLGLLSCLSSGQSKPRPSQPELLLKSSLYSGGPPMPNYAPKLLKYVDTAEMVRGPQHHPGNWVVSGARLAVEKGKIALRVKYSSLTAKLPDEST